MCWNEPVSWTTFIIGTILNLIVIFYIRKPVAYALAFICEWVLLMQFFEALIWRSKGKKNGLNKFGTNGAMISNLLQPLIIFMILIWISNVNSCFKIMSIILTISYVFYIIYRLNQIDNINYVNLDNCTHINYTWWKQISTIPYIILVLSLVLLLLRPITLSLIQCGFILLALFIAWLGFSSESIGSIWCWLVAIAPVLVLVCYKFGLI